MSGFENTYFDSDEEVFAWFRDHADDIETVIVPVQDGMMLIGPQGQQSYAKGCGAMVKLVDGTSRLIHRAHAESLINDGLLQRLRVKCKLFPLTAAPE
jgi:hypothetical protein